MTDYGRDINAITVEPSGVIYVYVGEDGRRMRLQREKWDGYVWGWSATDAPMAGLTRGCVFGHWHQMMAYVLQEQALTPAEYKVAYEMREAK